MYLTKRIYIYKSLWKIHKMWEKEAKTLVTHKVAHIKMISVIVDIILGPLEWALKKLSCGDVIGVMTV